jgi:hypothetical protein
MKGLLHRGVGGTDYYMSDLVLMGITVYIGVCSVPIDLMK